MIEIWQKCPHNALKTNELCVGKFYSTDCSSYSTRSCVNVQECIINEGQCPVSIYIFVKTKRQVSACIKREHYILKTSKPCLKERSCKLKRSLFQTLHIINKIKYKWNNKIINNKIKTDNVWPEVPQKCGSVVPPNCRTRVLICNNLKKT